MERPEIPDCDFCGNRGFILTQTETGNRYELCPHCKRGLYPKELGPECSYCRGAGLLKTYVTKTQGFRYRTCPECGGKGRV